MAKRRNETTGEELEDADEQETQQKSEPTEAEKRAAQKETESNSDLVKMRNGDQVLHIHHSNVAHHEKLGWVRA
jgi:hypothetical protein